jgi:DNA-binding transcriptional regulator/RsmH inhibitor MraZ
MEPSATTGNRLRAPYGFHTCKIDTAGRVKLPARYLEYLEKIHETDLFVTEHGGLARVFTNGSWEKLVAKLDEDTALRKRFTFRAESIGGDTTIDDAGRITLPQRLREQLKLVNEQAYLRFYDDVITIYPQAQYDAEAEKVNAYRQADEDRVRELGVDL